MLDRLLSIEALKDTKKFLKVPLRGTFKNFFEFYKNAECLLPTSNNDRPLSDLIRPLRLATDIQDCDRLKVKSF